MELVPGTTACLLIIYPLAEVYMTCEFVASIGKLNEDVRKLF